MGSSLPGDALIESLVQGARAAANAGNWAEAERLWREVHRRDQSNPQALFGLGVHAIQRRDFPGALKLIERACASSPNDVLALITLGVVRRELGDANGELAAIDAALAVDPYALPALLAKAAWYERQGEPVMAGRYYGIAVKFAPPRAHWPDALRGQLEHAAAVADQHARALEARLLASMGETLAGLPRAVEERWRESASIVAGRTQPYNASSNQLHVARLPAVPFFDPQEFPWAAALEAKTDAIRAELEVALQKFPDRFAPYVDYKSGAPTNQWRDLNKSQRWSAFQLWRNGTPVEANLEVCSVTAAALRDVEMAEMAGLCPNAMFSALAPRTHIPPHTGETNARIVAHLPLIVPDKCSYRVGFEHRRWDVGKLLVFDDTLDHEARNDSDELRVVLIFDIWNPYLTPPEREVACRMMEALRTP